MLIGTLSAALEALDPQTTLHIVMVVVVGVVLLSTVIVLGIAILKGCRVRMKGQVQCDKVKGGFQMDVADEHDRLLQEVLAWRVYFGRHVQGVAEVEEISAAENESSDPR